MLVSEVALPTKTQAPVYSPPSPAAPADAAPVESSAAPAQVPTDTATSRTEIEIRLAFEFGVRLSFDGAVSGRGDHGQQEGIEAYEDDHDEDDDRLAKLAKGMTKALGHAIHEGMKAFFGDEDQLSKADRKQLKELEHELKHALKDAYKGNREDDQIDLLGFATDALSAVQDFAQGFGDFFAGAFPQVDAGGGDGGAADGGATADPGVAAVPDPFVGVTQGPTLVNKVEPTAVSTPSGAPVADSGAPVGNTAAPIDPSVVQRHEDDHDHRRFDFGRFFGAGDPAERFTRVSSLLERITAQLQDMVDALQPADETDQPAIVDPSAPVVDPNRNPDVTAPSIYSAQMSFAASFSLEASINLVA